MGENINKCRSFNLTSIKALINDLEINYVSTYNSDFLDGSIHIKQSFDNPFVIVENLVTGYCLYINEKWYLKHKKDVDTLIINIVNKSVSEDFCIATNYLINDDLIFSISKNNYIKLLTLGKIDSSDNEKYVLKKSDYLKLKDSNIKGIYTGSVDEELIEVFDPIIDYNKKRYLIDKYKYCEISSESTKNIFLDKKLSDEEIYNLKFIGSEANIILFESSFLSIDDICSRLYLLNKKNKVILLINKEQLENLNLKNKQYENLFIYLDNTLINLNEYFKLDNLLNLMVEQALNLSPFEKYIYAYNLTKQFKEYKENDEDKLAARNLHLILKNDYIVCAGFSELFGSLLDKLQIPNINLSLKVDTSYQYGNYQKEAISTEKVGHARRYVYIKDDKYGINGFYHSDPTWDNDLGNDYYNYLAFTDSESVLEYNYLWIDTYEIIDLFNIKDIYEFYEKINFLLSRHLHDDLQDIIDKIIFILSCLDKNYVDFLDKKYKINECNYEEQELLYDLGNYILKHVNKSIDGDIIMDAVKVIYEKIYGYPKERITLLIEKLRLANEERQEISFPVRYKEYSNGKKITITNHFNKFGERY